MCASLGLEVWPDRAGVNNNRLKDYCSRRAGHRGGAKGQGRRSARPLASAHTQVLL